MPKVSRRGGFSDRNRIKPENTEIQLREFDKRTRIQLQNMISQLYNEVFEENTDYRNSWIQDYCRFVIGDIYSEPINLKDMYYDDIVFTMINSTIQNDEYDDVLTLIEALIQYWDIYLKENTSYYYDSYMHKYHYISLYERANRIFERECIGYRFIDGCITPISDEFEIKEINEALNSKYNVVYEHLSKANKYIADRNTPDYENSIKESISAVEAICEILTDTKGKEATLSNMLKKMEEKNIKIHSGLKSAFNTLYGYTSDANGIRHAGDIGGPSSTFEEAKFMLVACSAFINYLLAINADKKTN